MRKPAVTAGVSREVDRLDLHAAAEVEHVAVGEAVRVGTRREVELVEHCVCSKRLPRLALEPYTAIRPSSDRTPGRSASWTWTRASANRPLPAMWSSWLWLLMIASTGAGTPPRDTTSTDGSMSTVSPAPRTSSELPDG